MKIFTNWLQNKVLLAFQSGKIEYSPYSAYGLGQKEILDFVVNDFANKAISHIDSKFTFRPENTNVIKQQLKVFALNEDEKQQVMEYRKTINYFKFFKEWPIDYPGDVHGIKFLCRDLAKFVESTWPEDEDLPFNIKNMSLSYNLRLASEIQQDYLDERNRLRANVFCKDMNRFQQIIAICKRKSIY